MTVETNPKRRRQMRSAQRAQEFRAVQRESTQVVAVLRKVLFSIGHGDASSPVQGGFSTPPSPSGGPYRTPARDRGRSRWAFSGQFVPLRMGLEPITPITVGTGKVTDRRNSTLRCYFRHCG